MGTLGKSPIAEITGIGKIFVMKAFMNFQGFGNGKHLATGVAMDSSLPMLGVHVDFECLFGEVDLVALAALKVWASAQVNQLVFGHAGMVLENLVAVFAGKFA